METNECAAEVDATRAFLCSPPPQFRWLLSTQNVRSCNRGENSATAADAVVFKPFLNEPSLQDVLIVSRRPAVIFPH